MRWLRVAQREHYLPGQCTRFALRWARSGAANAVGCAVLVVAALAAPVAAPVAVLAAGLAVAWPHGLGLRGRTAPLAWTARLRRLAVAASAVAAGGAALAALVGRPGLSLLVAPIAPAIVDLATAALAPVERRLAERWVRAAEDKLARMRPTVVAITGSYGKTSTKHHVVDIAGATLECLASRGSFNNRLGLARSINEDLHPGVDVFVAEMGTYGPGEIAELCSWLRPDISVITAIGPVHLERMGSIEAIVAAKSEILAGARTAVLNVADPHLAEVAAGLDGPQVIGASSEPGADICVVADGDELHVSVGGDEVTVPRPAGAHPGNLACAVGVAHALGVPLATVAARLPGVRTVEHRAVPITVPGRATVIDDTYNSNPEGARQALAPLAAAAPEGHRVLVTPGMIELGGRQAEENTAFAAAASAVCDTVLVVGRTNRAALERGVTDGAVAIPVATREDAVAWVGEHLGEGDAVLFENDLPDHYP